MMDDVNPSALLETTTQIPIQASRATVREASPEVVSTYLDRVVRDERPFAAVFALGFDADPTPEIMSGVARRLSAALTTLENAWATLDTMAVRMDDVFVVLMRGIPSTVSAAAFAESVLFECDQPMRTAVGEVQVAMSAGIARCAAGDGAHVLADALEALGEARIQGGRSVTHL